ncbi:MAG: hypothetical protein R2939_05125 [Kofleriaceae bacterium]
MQPTDYTLWNLVERLQRRLERQGLRGRALDVAVTDALRRALGG